MPPAHIRIDASPQQLMRAFFKTHAYTQVAMLTDTHTLRACYPLVKDHLPAHRVLTVAAGEEQKTLDTCVVVWRALTDWQFDRHGLLLVLGGGVLGDLGGFCAATYKRGIDFVLMPTTLLAQVDASVGGKLGIDFDSYKNHVGVFCEPRATLISPAFLATLPPRELRSGFAEVVKHCLMFDRAQWDALRTQPWQQLDWQAMIAHSVAVKSGVVQRDPREKGERKALNFGHTIGHALESASLLSADRLFHGEAIAAGMMAESAIARSKGLLTSGELEQICGYLVGIYGKVTCADSARVWGLMQQDKKNKGSKVLAALPKGIGNAVWDVEISEEEVRNALAFYDTL
jgi:3-dehydroquinate synthase